MVVGSSWQVSEEVMCASVALHFVLNGDVSSGEGAPQGGRGFVVKMFFSNKIRCTAAGCATVELLKL